MFYTYIYYDPTRNNEPFYVGKGKETRAWVHLNETGPNKHFMNRIKHIRANNAEPIIGIYAGFDSELAFLVEEELVAKYGRRDLGTGTLHNLTDGGDAPPIQKKRGKGTGKPLTEEAKKKIREARAKQTNLAYGKRSEEAKKKMSDSHKGIEPWNKGIPHSEDTKEKLKQYSGENHHAYGKPGRRPSDETRKKMSEKAKGRTPWNKGLSKYKE